MKTALLLLMASFTIITSKAKENPNPQKQRHMTLNSGIVTSKLAESKAFYTENLGFTVSFENEFYLLLGLGDQSAALSFLLPNHPSQQPVFHKPYQGQGCYLTIEMDEVDELYQKLKEKGVEMSIELRDEPWGDRHFAIIDPNGLAIDIVRYRAPQN